MVSVAFLPGAQADYEEALTWYEARSARAALGFQQAVADGVQQIAEHPESYASIDNRHRRHLLKGYPYSLIYRVETFGVLVVAVAHSSRSSRFWRRRG